jgi:Cu(I)/Ag(I) efflux system membrane fusion protein
MTMKRINATLAPLAFLAFAALPVHGADMKDMPDMQHTPGMKMDAAKTAVDQGHRGHGTVNSVDAKAGKVNLTHGPIATLKWPGMTMDFAVSDKQALAKLKAGQKVEFKVAEQSKGQYVITEIGPAK